MSNNSKPLPEHWTTTELRGAPGAFQRAAREYAEEYARAYAALQVAAERERWESVVFDGWRVLKGLDEAAAKRTTHQNVSDTLDALMRVLRA